VAFESAFLELMPHTVTRKAWAGRDSYGKPSYSTATASSYRARVVAKPLTLAGPQGIELVATHIMYLATTDNIGAKDQITYDGSTFRIIEIGREPDQDGMHHTWLRTRGA
jgi:hypothetical protein